MNVSVAATPLAPIAPAILSLIRADGLVIDKLSGEIFGFDDKPSVFDLMIDYTQPKPSSLASLLQTGWLLDPDFGKEIADDFADAPEDEEPEKDDDEKSAKSGGGGRPPKMFYNERVTHIQTAHAMNARWLDDYVWGACYVCTGANNGKLNVSPTDVLRVCMMPVICTKIVKKYIVSKRGLPVSTRQAQRLVKAAIFAVGGIDLYIIRHSDELAALEYEVDFADAYQPGTLAELPCEGSSTDLVELATDNREEPLTVVLRTERKYQHFEAFAA